MFPVIIYATSNEIKNTIFILTRDRFFVFRTLQLIRVFCFHNNLEASDSIKIKLTGAKLRIPIFLRKHIFCTFFSLIFFHGPLVL